MQYRFFSDNRRDIRRSVSDVTALATIVWEIRQSVTRHSPTGRARFTPVPVRPPRTGESPSEAPSSTASPCESDAETRQNPGQPRPGRATNRLRHRRPPSRKRPPAARPGPPQPDGPDRATKGPTCHAVRPRRRSPNPAMPPPCRNTPAAAPGSPASVRSNFSRSTPPQARSSAPTAAQSASFIGVDDQRPERLRRLRAPPLDGATSNKTLAGINPLSQFRRVQPQAAKLQPLRQAQNRVHHRPAEALPAKFFLDQDHPHPANTRRVTGQSGRGDQSMALDKPTQALVRK